MIVKNIDWIRYYFLCLSIKSVTFITFFLLALHNFIRLTGGRRSSEGRVELWYNGKWGTICSQHFDANAASVVCRTLGYSG